MARFVAVAVTLLLVLACAPRAGAEAPGPTVLIVVKGVPLAAALRQRLARQFGAGVVSVVEAASGAEQPAAMVGVKYVASSGLAVAYLDRLGRSEVLSVAVSDAAAIADVAFGLTSALIARHLPGLTATVPAAPAAFGGQSSDAAAVASSQWARGSAWPQGYAPRRASILLSLDDF